MEENIHIIQAKKIIQIIEDYYKINIRENSRKREFVLPRQIAMYFIDIYVKVSMQKNASLFNMNHATVVHSKKVVQRIIKSKLKYDIEAKNDIETLRPKILKTYEIVSKDHKKYLLKSEITDLVYNMNEEDLEELKTMLTDKIPA